MQNTGDTGVQVHVVCSWWALSEYLSVLLHQYEIDKLFLESVL